ncbi:hypothetical protein, partial [Stenotrophomonas maltophilia group sp. RNC7]|uniref:hypothetical protein n=1 Tax=Stenotrophomonas maltophilia group sp. RNC7 TaxID=3071467 RepID=UPI0027E1D43A
MNNREDAILNISQFLTSDEKCMLLTGTHQYEKHKLVLKIIKELINESSTILFRVNGMNNVNSIFENNNLKVKPGISKRIGNHKIFIDSINSITWDKSPYNIDYGIIYPIDSVCRCKN